MAPTEVAITTVTTAATMPSANSDWVLFISCERMSRPAGSVPSQCAAEGGDGFNPRRAGSLPRKGS